MVRAPACHAGGQGVEPPYRRQFASVAQLVEQGTENPRVVGSIPTGGTIINADLAHLVERNLAKVEVAGSSPVIRSSKATSSTDVALFIRRHGQVVRHRSATPLLLSSNLSGASKNEASQKGCFFVLGALFVILSELLVCEDSKF